MLLTPEMDELLPKLGVTIRKHYKVLKREFEQIDEIENLNPASLQWAFDYIENMKPIYVEGKYLALYKTMLSFLQLTLAQRLSTIFSQAAFRDFVFWSDKLSQFKEREKWWFYANNVISEVGKNE
jgi:hypothetical protein